MFFPITCVVVAAIVVVVVDVARLMFMLLEIQPRTTATTTSASTVATDFLSALSVHFGLFSLSLSRSLAAIGCIRTVIDG